MRAPASPYRAPTLDGAERNLPLEGVISSSQEGEMVENEGQLAREGQRAADTAAREAAPWVERLARAGYAAKGVVYILVGGLAVAAAAGQGGETTGSSGALSTLSDTTWGRMVLGLIAIGLAGYVVWSVVRAVRDPEDEGTGSRLFFGLTAVIYALLAVEAARMALSGPSGGGGGGNGAAHWSAQLMQQPFGLWLVGAAGVAVAGYGLQQLINAWRVDLDDQLALGRLSAAGRTWAVRAGRAGLAARGVVFLIIGYYFVQSALQATPSEARGIDGVLDSLRDTPWLLGVIALGLVAYGVYNLVRARYRVIRPAA